MEFSEPAIESLEGRVTAKIVFETKNKSTPRVNP